jgi:hypothetical protein
MVVPGMCCNIEVLQVAVAAALPFAHAVFVAVALPSNDKLLDSFLKFMRLNAFSHAIIFVSNSDI